MRKNAPTGVLSLDNDSYIPPYPNPPRNRIPNRPRPAKSRRPENATARRPHRTLPRQPFHSHRQLMDPLTPSIDKSALNRTRNGPAPALIRARQPTHLPYPHSDALLRVSTPPFILHPLHVDALGGSEPGEQQKRGIGADPPGSAPTSSAQRTHSPGSTTA